MKKIIFFFLIVTVLMFTGCGTSNEGQDGDGLTTGSGGGSNNGEVNENNDDDGNTENGIVAGELVPSILEDGTLVFKYEVINQTEEEVTLEFSSSQRYDYSIRKDGQEIYLFSSLASFMQMMGDEVLSPGEKLSYEIDLNELGLEAGDYTLEVWLTPIKGPKYLQEIEFSVE
ncbi:BsuPI-related putative proteinase inhibitor [Evansella sp. AB-rgal1]|uniref:BsuPI-related putative proteinase inhibitor n=1 Tax=Evansella sp. AB-rgal1 TaxID=3242696 RepID=UPI00359CC475